ncbi:MAG: spermine synthase [Candidatus Chloroheliales bacterium]|nr:MAG: spermine synthase [Chloroflexota bacterium]
MHLPPILSHYQVAPILEARRKGQPTVTTSLDLGRSSVELSLMPGGLLLPDGHEVDWATLEKIKRDENKCFTIEDGNIAPIIVHSPTTNWVRTLYPTAAAPTTLVAGFLMHRIKDIDPLQDTRRKIAALAPISGNVLDTATGLGYTAIEAGRTASHVTTIELDPGALEIARLNPWSQELFDNPKISQIIGDTAEVIQQFAAGHFDRILHDPPTLSLGGELYSAAFYAQLYRVLRRGGRLFHYIGDLSSNYGSRTVKGVTRRLQEVGFSRVTRKDEAFGLVAGK